MGLCPIPRGLLRSAMPVIKRNRAINPDHPITVYRQQASESHLCVAHIYAVSLVFTVKNFLTKIPFTRNIRHSRTG